jgi:hypothetical protein
MRAVQDKAGIAVVNEQKLLPSRGSVAALASRSAFALGHSHKLPIVDVAMTPGTFQDQRFHPERRVAGFGVHDGMTLQAQDFAVSALKGKARQLVIKGSAVPCFGRVAEFAAVSFNPVIQLSLVRVAMAATAGKIGKLVACIAAFSRLGFRVTSKAGHGQMTPGQRVAGAVMHRPIENTWAESIDRMTFLASAVTHTMRQLSVMAVVMAVGTKRMS